MYCSSSASQVNASPPDREKRPTVLPVIPDNIPSEMKACDQWIGWSYDWVEKTNKQTGKKSGKFTKIPKCVRGGNASSTDPATWASFDDVLAIYQSGAHEWSGIGFVFSKDDPFGGIDLDKCLEPGTRTLKPWAVPYLEQTCGYVEISPSDTGLKIFSRLTLPADSRNQWIWPDHQVEIYDQGRFFAVTGHQWEMQP